MSGPVNSDIEIDSMLLTLQSSSNIVFIIIMRHKRCFGVLNIMANSLCGPLIKRLHDTLEKRANNALRSQELTMVQNNVLMLLAEVPGKQASLKEVERLMHVAQSTTAGIIVRLEQKGFIEGFEDPADRRIKRIRITRLGEQCCVFARASSANEEQKLLTGFSDEERATFYRLLQKAIDNVI